MALNLNFNSSIKKSLTLLLKATRIDMTENREVESDIRILAGVKE